MKETLRRFGIVLVWSAVIIFSIMGYAMYLKNWLYFVIICLGFIAHKAVNWVFQKENKSDNNVSDNVNSSEKKEEAFHLFYDIFRVKLWLWLTLMLIIFALIPKGMYYEYKAEYNDAGAYGTLAATLIVSMLISYFLNMLVNVFIYLIKRIFSGVNEP